MDPQHTRLMQDTIRSRLQAQIDAPPPYSPSDTSDSEDDGDDEEPLKLTINAAHNIQGSNNLIPTSSSPLADASKFSTLLLHAVKQMNGLDGKSRRSMKVDLTINCGLTVVGDRNVIGNVGLKPKCSNGTIAGPSAVVGAKRKAEEDADGDEPAAKRVAARE